MDKPLRKIRPIIKCTECNGEGWIDIPQNFYGLSVPLMRACLLCRGTGFVSSSYYQETPEDAICREREKEN